MSAKVWFIGDFGKGPQVATNRPRLRYRFHSAAMGLRFVASFKRGGINEAREPRAWWLVEAESAAAARAAIQTWENGNKANGGPSSLPILIERWSAPAHSEMLGRILASGGSK